MKRLNKLFLMVLLISGVFIFSACGGGSKNVTLRFETGGGDKVPSISVSKNEECTLPTPTREGYSFAGWYLNDDFSGDVVTKFTAEKNTTFYAKWEQLFTLTLNANGGNLSVNSLQFKAGDKLSAVIKNVVITPPADHQFGAWFNGDNAVDENFVLPSGDLTLTAKYKVRYVLHTYVENVDGSGYTQDKDVKTGYDYAGSKPNVDVTGYTVNDRSDVKELSGEASKNEFNVYYDRIEATVMLDANYPDQSPSEQKEIKTKFGAKIKLENDFVAEGYIIAGWNTDGSDNITYKSSFIYDMLYNKEGVEAPEDYTVNDEYVVLFAVWARGMNDVFGGSDLIYHFGENDREIYLCRNEKYFVGRYLSETRTFVFTPNDDSLIEGKLCDDGTFVYADHAKANATYVLYSDTNIKLYIDAYNGVRYAVMDPETRLETSSQGSYKLDESTGDVLYIATFEKSGPVAGQTLVIRLDNENNYFYVRNDEELIYGTVYRYVDEDRYYPNAYYINFTGFGTVQYSTGNNQSTIFRCIKDTQSTGNGDYYDLYNSNNGFAGRIWIVLKGTDQQGQNIYGYYLIDQEHADITYVSADGAQLTLDGIYTATFKGANNRIVKGNYTISDSWLGGELVTMTSGSTSYCFIIHTIEHKVGDDDDAEITYEYKLETRLGSYRELLYMAASGKAYRIPLFALDETEEGKMTIYGLDSENKYVKIATADYTMDNAKGRGTARNISLTDAFEGSEYRWNLQSDMNIDLADVKSFGFGVVSNSGNVFYYIYSIDFETAEDKTYDIIYNGQNGATLTLISTFAYYEYTAQDGSPVVEFGAFTRSNNIITLSASVEYRFEVNDDERSFDVLDKLYGTAYTIDGSANIVRTKSLVFDGKGGVEYTDGETKRSGSYTQSEDKKYYIFTSDGFTMQFKLVLLNNSSVVFVAFNEDVSGVFNNDDGSKLTLDGYIDAVYVDVDGNSVEGTFMYTANETEKYVTMTINGVVRYFDLKDGHKFTLRGSEYTRRLLWYDNQYVRPDIYFGLDGYGKLFVYDSQGGLIETGEYSSEDGENYSLKYGEYTRTPLEGVLGIVIINNTMYSAFIVEHTNMVGTYINTYDWTIMTLDSYGNIVINNNLGKEESGLYRIINDEIIYCTVGDKAGIYVVDAIKKTVTPKKFDAYGYYTENFEALNFSEYGFVFIEGERAYFIVDDRDEVIIYRAPQEGETPNKYGFVEEKDFGKFSETKKVYKGKTYYRASGYSLSFGRKEDTQDKYPVRVSESVKAPLRNLSFTLVNNGDKPGEFDASGRVFVEGQSTPFQCRVVRNILDDESVEFYIMIASTGGGYFRFDIDLTFKGEDAGLEANSYSITDMAVIREYKSYSYWNNYFMMYYSLGPAFASYLQSEDYIKVVTQFNDQGEESESKFYAQFGVTTLIGLPISVSEIRDYNGDFIKLDGVPVSVSGSMYTVEFEYEADGHTYVLRIGIQPNIFVGQYGFVVSVFTRKQTLTTDDGNYEIEVERIIASESGYVKGNIFSANLRRKVADQEYELLPLDIGIIREDGSLMYVVRSREDDKITSTTYYYIRFTEHVNTEVNTGDEGDEGDEQTDDYVPVEYYTSATVTSQEMKTYYNESGDSYADIDETNNEIILFAINGTYYLVDECSYDNGTYTVHTTAGVNFEITKDGDKLTFNRLPDDEQAN